MTTEDTKADYGLDAPGVVVGTRSAGSLRWPVPESPGPSCATATGCHSRDLMGYTRLTEEQGDQAAAGLAETLAVLVGRSAREHAGVPVKWLGDGVMG